MRGRAALDAYLGRDAKQRGGRRPPAPPEPRPAAPGSTGASAAAHSPPTAAPPPPRRPLSRSFTSPFRPLSERAAAAAATPVPPSTSFKLPASPLQRGGGPAGGGGGGTLTPGAPLGPISLRGGILDSSPPSTRTAMLNLERHLQRFEAAPVAAALRGASSGGGATPAPLSAGAAGQLVREPSSVGLSSELSTFQQRWSGRLGGGTGNLPPRPAPATCGAQPRQQQAAALPAPPAWLQPELFSGQTYLDSAMKKHRAAAAAAAAAAASVPWAGAGLGEARKKLGDLALEGNCCAGARKRLDLGPLALRPVEQQRQQHAVGVPLLRPAVVGSSSPSPHRAWGGDSGAAAAAAPAAGVLRPSLAHTGTDPMSPLGSPARTLAACQTSPAAGSCGSGAPSRDASLEPRSRRPGSPHAAYLPRSPSATHRAFLRELREQPWECQPSRRPASAPCLRRDDWGLQGHPTSARGSPARHTTARFAASRRQAPASPGALAAQLPRRPQSAAPGYLLPAGGTARRRVRCGALASTSPGPRQRAVEMLRQAAGVSGRREHSRSPRSSSPAAPASPLRLQAAAMLAAAKGSSAGLSTPQRHALAADGYLERARQSVAARQAARQAAQPALRRAALGGPEVGGAAAKCTPGSLADRLGAQQREDQCFVVAAQPAGDQWQSLDSLLSLRQRLGRLLSESDSEAERGGACGSRGTSTASSPSSSRSVSPPGALQRALRLPASATEAVDAAFHAWGDADCRSGSDANGIEQRHWQSNGAEAASSQLGSSGGRGGSARVGSAAVRPSFYAKWLAQSGDEGVELADGGDGGKEPPEDG